MPTNQRLALLTSLFLTASVAGSVPASAQTYTLKDLSVYGDSVAYDINNVGQVAGYTRGFYSNPQAFLYSNGKTQEIGTLTGPGFLNADKSEAYGINNSGSVVGVSDTSQHTPDGYAYQHAFLYADSHMTDLGTLGGSSSAAYAINSLGDVVGDAQEANFGSHAFLYRNGVMTDLGVLGAGAKGQGNSYATGINDAGEIVGNSDLYNADGDDLGFHAFLVKNGQMINLGANFEGRSFASGINRSGEVVGWGDDSFGHEHPLLWDDGQMMNLGLPEGYESGKANAINDQGEVVGALSGPDGKYSAFLWSNSKGYTILDNLIVNNPGWKFDPLSINDAGQVVGLGYYGGNHAFLLTPNPTAVPEASSVLTLGSLVFGLAGVLMYARRRSALHQS